MTARHDLPSRRDRRLATSHRRTRRKIVQQLSVLCALAAATVALPLSGFVSPNFSATAPTHGVAVAAASSWADIEQQDGDADGSPLKAEPAAVTRARLQEAVGSCDLQGAASGDRQALVDPESVIYFPLTKGSFQVSSPFGYRVHPITHQVRLHAGADFAAPSGTPVYAVAAGQVDFVGRQGAGGNVVRIHHRIDGEDFYTQYHHLLDGGIVVSVGQQVEAGQLIAHVGSTGGSTGPHLHLEVHPTLDNPVDPVGWLKEHHSVYLGDEDCR